MRLIAESCFLAVSGDLNLAIDRRVIENEDLKTFTVSKGAVNNIRLSELDDTYFEVLRPDEIRYTFRARLAKGFGATFVSVD